MITFFADFKNFTILSRKSANKWQLVGQCECYHRSHNRMEVWPSIFRSDASENFVPELITPVAIGQNDCAVTPKFVPDEKPAITCIRKSKGKIVFHGASDF